MSERSSNAFDPRVVFGLLLFGALAFFLTLYFIGTGQTGGSENDGRAHAVSRGLTGYAGIVKLLEEEGHDVDVSRSRDKLDQRNLLIVTPPKFAEAEDVAKIIADRRYVGPTLVVLPKWNEAPASMFAGQDVEEGWVELVGASVPDWAENLDEAQKDSNGNLGYSLPVELNVEVAEGLPSWRGMDRSGRLPDGMAVQEIEQGNLVGLVFSARGKPLAGYLDDGGYYPAYEEAAGYNADADPENYGGEQYGVVIVAEPDLLNNYGMADRTRAELGHALVDMAMDGDELPIVFDVTLNGLGGTQNLLTLAFTPPFLAATLCLILAMIVVAWRAFKRFGPPAAEGRAIAYGKAQLVRNSAGFIQRTRRLHLLSGPYASMMRERIARALALRKPDDAAIDAALARRLPDEPPFTRTLAALRNARTRAEIVRAADALKSIERKLAR
ncbi:DUF4350 domain-containing protein [Parerythrobacter lacustris]|uniref:DUF4350 domain-containing protein n=1 Tax=Parerythrobacter lacustris TaxID=2969984 RepID=A0ABT1XM30_9SPHN|nr:DUF4350 domain-containing protein [Parerythrobacter lacustris]MCR2832720.1 DUF4350 domain-containing protein [Parerythrobacter lacustris]